MPPRALAFARLRIAFFVAKTAGGPGAVWLVAGAAAPTVVAATGALELAIAGPAGPAPEVAVGTAGGRTSDTSAAARTAELAQEGAAAARMAPQEAEWWAAAGVGPGPPTTRADSTTKYKPC